MVSTRYTPPPPDYLPSIDKQFFIGRWFYFALENATKREPSPVATNIETKQKNKTEKVCIADSNIKPVSNKILIATSKVVQTKLAQFLDSIGIESEVL